MRQFSGVLGAVATLSLIVAPGAAITLDCEAAQVDGVRWNFGALAGKHTVKVYAQGASKDRFVRTTYDLNICRPMKSKETNKECHRGSHICGIREHIDADGESHDEDPTILPIAVQDPLTSRYHLDPVWAKLEGSESASDAEKQGVSLKLHGLKDTIDGDMHLAIIDFQCKKAGKKERDLEQREDDKKDDGKKDDGDDKEKDGDDEDDDEEQRKEFEKAHKEWMKEKSTDDGHDGNLTFVSYSAEKLPDEKNSAMVLRLIWETPYACEDADPPPSSSGGGWGFFSWLFFLSFIGVLAYFAFFAWINYTRYGKSGFDMLPHADTLRELPQLLGEYAGKVVNTVRGGRASGGYSAL